MFRFSSLKSHGQLMVIQSILPELDAWWNGKRGQLEFIGELDEEKPNEILPNFELSSWAFLDLWLKDSWLTIWWIS